MSIQNSSVFKGFLDSSKKVTIFLPSKPDFDTVAAALGLKLSLDHAGKSVRVVCSDPMLVEFNRLVGVDTISETFGSRNLIIAFPDQTESVDNVSYNIEKGVLQLVISPKADAPELDHKKLQFVTSAGKQDLLITLGTPDLHDLGSVYYQTKEFFQDQSVPVVSISRQPLKTQYTTNQIIDSETDSLSEIVADLTDQTGLSLDQDSASNLLAGLEKATDNFRSPKVSVRTFEVAARLMRKGAKRPSELSAQDFPAGAIPSAAPEAETPPAKLPEPVEKAPDQLPVEQQQTQQPVQQKTQQASDDAQASKPSGKKSAPADWYEPKIYKGPMLP